MVKEIIWAPGATPFFSGLSGKHPAAIAATCVPCDAKPEKNYEHKLIF